MKLSTSFQRLVFFLFLGLILLGAGLLISSFWQLIFMAAILVFVLSPVLQWLSRKTKLNSKILTALIYIVLLILVLIPFYIGLVIIGDQAAQLAAILATADGSEFAQLFEDLNRWVQQVFGINLQALLERVGQFIRDNLGQILTAIANFIAEATGSVLNVLINFILFSFLFVVMLPNWGRMRTTVIRHSPFDPTLNELYLRHTGLITRDVLLGTFGVAFIQTLILWVVFSLLGLPFAGLLSLFVFIFGLIPLLGISLVTIPLGIVLILLNQWQAALVIWLVHLFIINNVDLALRPLITSKELQIHPGFLIIGFIGGLPAFGLVGLFLGPMLVILLKTSLEVYVENYGHSSETNDLQLKPREDVSVIQAEQA